MWIIIIIMYSKLPTTYGDVIDVWYWFQGNSVELNNNIYFIEQKKKKYKFSHYINIIHDNFHISMIISINRLNETNYIVKWIHLAKAEGIPIVLLIRSYFLINFQSNLLIRSWVIYRITRTMLCHIFSRWLIRLVEKKID